MNDSSVRSEIVSSNLTALKFYKNFATLICWLQEFGYETGDIQAALNADDCDSAFGLVRQQLVGQNSVIEDFVCYRDVERFLRVRSYQKYVDSFQTLLELMKHDGYSLETAEMFFEVGEWFLAWKSIQHCLSVAPNPAIETIEAYQCLRELFDRPVVDQDYAEN